MLLAVSSVPHPRFTNVSICLVAMVSQDEERLTLFIYSTYQKINIKIAFDQEVERLQINFSLKVFAMLEYSSFIACNGYSKKLPQPV